MYSPTTYADLYKVINDKTYATEKYLIVKKFNLTTHELYIVKYNKNFLNHDNIKTLGLFRSIIVDKEGKIISFAPPKSIAFDYFLKEEDRQKKLKKEEIEEENIEMSEFCEGTMISLFWDPHRNDWELATKGNIGARCKFFQEYPKTFRRLFLEILTEKDIELEQFEKSYIYSFVIQHPDNRIVVPFEKMDMKLIQMYQIDESNNIIGLKNIADIQKKIKENNINIETPQLLNKILDLTNHSLKDMNELFNNLNLSWKIVGGMFINTESGIRTKLRNPSYEYVKRLKGNNPKIQFQYYSLRQNNKVKEYLKYYPEKKIEFAKLRIQLHKWTNALYKNYISCYIKKEAPLRNFPHEFKNHMFQIHQKFIEELRPNGSYVSKSVVVNYVNCLPPPRLMYVINFKLRQNIVTNHINDIEQNVNSEVN
jgi:hypothetical protein